jgi:short subunit dehydrogenase-like uncharacterized protein
MKSVLITGATINTGVAIVEKFAAEGKNIVFTGRDPEKVAIDVTTDLSFDWFGFANYHLSKQIYGNSAKIDVWDQLAWQWEAFVDYCWHTGLPYERDNPKFHE